MFSIINVQKELRTLKNRVRAYKGWTKRYRKKQKELQQEAIILRKDCNIAYQERDRAKKELHAKQQELVSAIGEAKQAKELRDRYLTELDDIIAKIEQYKDICDRANKITYADKVYLIKEAEKLFFGEEIIDRDRDLVWS